MKQRAGILRILSLAVQLCGLLIPMYNIYPDGLMINSHSWFLTETFAALRDRGVEAFNFLGVAFHVAVWIPAIVLCAGSFIRSTRMVQLASVLGIALLLAGLLLAVILTGEWNLIHPVNGYICIGYWGDLILFAVCALLSSSKMGTLK